MNACSSDARVWDSSCSRTPASNAMSPVRSVLSPWTSSEPSPLAVAVPPAAATALASTSICGVRTRTVSVEFSAMNFSIVVLAISRPRPMTMMSSAVFSISDIRWLETNTVRPSDASAFIRFRIQRMPSGSSPLTGSSNISTSGSPSSVPAMPSRWLMPREKPLVRFFATSVRPTSASTSSTRRLGMSFVWARHHRWL